MANDDKDIGDDLKGLIVLYALCCYALRELTSLGASCRDAEEAITAAQAAIRARIASVEGGSAQSDANEDPEILLH